MTLCTAYDWPHDVVRVPRVTRKATRNYLSRALVSHGPGAQSAVATNTDSL